MFYRFGKVDSPSQVLINSDAIGFIKSYENASVVDFFDRSGNKILSVPTQEGRDCMKFLERYC